jgi:hypothetical protein
LNNKVIGSENTSITSTYPLLRSKTFEYTSKVQDGYQI